MNNINRAAVAGVIFFMVILAGFVGIQIEQTTVAILGGALIGLVVAIPTATAIIVIGLRKPAEQAPPQPQVVYQLPPQVTHNYYDNRRVVVAVNVPADTPESEYRFIVARELRKLPSEAQQMIDAGEVKCLPAGR